jgi:hypothetical protein
MAYPTDAQVKTWLNISGSGEDALITLINTGAKAYVERYCNRVFEAASSTKNFPIRKPYVSADRRVLSLFQDLASLTSVTNGDGVAFTVATELELHPVDAPYYQIRIKPTSGKVFQTTNDARIAVVGTWGLAATCPADIFMAILDLCQMQYLARMTGSAGAVQQIGQQGLIAQPAAIPATITDVLDAYKRYV